MNGHFLAAYPCGMKQLRIKNEERVCLNSTCCLLSAIISCVYTASCVYTVLCVDVLCLYVWLWLCDVSRSCSSSWVVYIHLYSVNELYLCIFVSNHCILRVTLENLEMSGNLTAFREMSGILLKIKGNVREKLPKTVYCKLHICVHTGI